MSETQTQDHRQDEAKVFSSKHMAEAWAQAL